MRENRTSNLPAAKGKLRGDLLENAGRPKSRRCLKPPLLLATSRPVKSAIQEVSLMINAVLTLTAKA
jgi:hypothetical protein